MTMQIDEGLQKVLMQLQSQHQEASRQLSVVRSQLGARERDKKLNTLTLREIEALPRDSSSVSCYRGVGRMFIQESRNNVENTLRGKMKDAGEEVSALEKKAKYLEGEMSTAQSSLRDILQEHAKSQ